MAKMEYRRLGRAGLKVSALSLGSWVTFGTKNQIETAAGAAACMATAKAAGVNFFDNAEAYAGGESERVMGGAIRELGWKRHEYVVSTKLFWGLHNQVNMRYTLNRKFLLQGIEGSLERFGLDFVDLVYCHRADPNTPIEETVWAMSDMINRGQALYWGTSEWSAAEIRAAYDIADRHHLHKPVMEQPEYSILRRQKVEVEYARLYEDIGLGTTTWSPLAQGLLTGKYLDGVPEGSRASFDLGDDLRARVADPENRRKVMALKTIADELGVSLAQFSLAWCLKNPRVSSVITGASSVAQVEQNMASLDVVPLLTDEVMARVSDINPLVIDSDV